MGGAVGRVLVEVERNVRKVILLVLQIENHVEDQPVVGVIADGGGGEDMLRLPAADLREQRA